MARMRKPLAVLLVLLAAICVRLLWVAAQIRAAGAVDEAAAADAIIVLGAAIEGSEPSPVFAARLEHGIALYRRAIAPMLVLTGGVGEGRTLAESEVGRSYAIARGVPAEAIHIETLSRTTRENLVEAARIVRERGGARVVLVSDPDHLYRAALMARDLGLAPLRSATPGSVYRSWRTRTPFLLREIYFVHHYQLTGR